MELHVPISSKGQVTIPKEVREHLKALPGDRLVFKKKDGTIFVEKYLELMTCPVCDGSGRLSSKFKPCFICKESGNLETDFSVLQSIPVWQKRYQIRTVCNFQSKVHESSTVPTLHFQSQTYTSEDLNQSRDFALLYLYKELQDENQGFLTIDEYRHLQEQLSIPESRTYMRIFEIREMN